MASNSSKIFATLKSIMQQTLAISFKDMACFQIFKWQLLKPCICIAIAAIIKGKYVHMYLVNSQKF